MTSLDDLLREARRLRFTDPELEGRFRAEQLAAGQTRARIMAFAAMLIVAVNGWGDAASLARTAPEFVASDLQLRFFVMVPAFFTIVVSMALPGHRRRADLVNALAVIIPCWADGLIFWLYRSTSPGSSVVGQLLGSVVPIMVFAVFTLPLAFRATLAAMLLTAGGIVAWFWSTQGAPPRSLIVLASGLFGFGGAAALLGWLRERAERTLFAQREQLRALNAELARLNTEKNEFMAVAAHDLRAPLGIVRGLLELLRDRRLASEDKQAAAVAQSHAETIRMLALVDSYLGAHAAESGTLPLRLERVDLGVAATAVATRHAEAARAKAQTLDVDAPTGRVWVRADEALLAQVSDNFLSNALKFSPPGAPVRIELLVAEDGGPARLAVVDQGPGIAETDRSKLFRKFGRLGHRTTGGETSVGLGLAVAKRLAEAMGGSVGCASETGRGATFWIELPQTSGDER